MALHTNGAKPITHTDGKQDSPPEPGNDDGKSLERKQREERDKNFGREQGGNQQGNQRGTGNPGDR